MIRHLRLRRYQSDFVRRVRIQHAFKSGYNTSPSCCRLHHHLALALAEGVGEALLVVLAEDIGEPRLPPVLVYTLGDLVPRGVTKTGE